MKRPGGDLLAVEMGMLFANSQESALRSVNADMVVPVPLHWQPRWLRGHNQAEELAYGVAGKLGLACRAHWLRRTRPAVQHAQPSSTARWENVKEAFAVRTRARFAGCTVIVIDDVMTTGSTMSEIARVLKLAGAKRVIACALARR